MNEKQKLKLWLRMHEKSEYSSWEYGEGKYYISGSGLRGLMIDTLGPEFMDRHDALNEIRKLRAFGVIMRVKGEDEDYYEEWKSNYIPNPDWRLLPKEFDDGGEE